MILNFCTISGAKSAIPSVLWKALVLLVANATDSAATSTTDRIVIIIWWWVVADAGSAARTQFARKSI